MGSETSYADWIAVDWGTSNLRVWAMRASGPVADARSDQGMGTLEPEAFEPALLDLIEPWLGAAPMPVIACGMVGAKQGWAEAPYAAVPCPPVSLATVTPNVQDRRLVVHILPGLSQASPADVMRGEETQIAGYLADVPEFDGILCMPGTHTKWVQVSAGEVVSFRTFMTGEMFALLSTGSVLRRRAVGRAPRGQGACAAVRSVDRSRAGGCKTLLAGTADCAFGVWPAGGAICRRVDRRRRSP